MGGCRDIGEAFVPFKQHLEIGIDQKRRPLAPLRQNKRGGQVGQFARLWHNAHRLPSGTGQFGHEARLCPIHRLGHSDFLHPRFARAPTVELQHMGCRNDGIGGRTGQGDQAIAIAILTPFQNVAGQHLHHTNLARPSAFGLTGGEISFCGQSNGRHHLGLKNFRAAAIMGQGEQRIARVKIALHLPKIRLKGPKGQNNPTRDAKLLLGRFESRIVFAPIDRGVVDAIF